MDFLQAVGNKFNSMSYEDRSALVDGLSDHQVEALATYSASFSGTPMTDVDGFSISNFDGMSPGDLQQKCWNIFNENPQINSHVRDYMGMLTGYGFDTESEIPEIQDLIDKISEDVRNEFHKNMSKFVARAEIQGELFLALTLHKDGFVEVNFMDCQNLKSGGDDGSGIFFHPKKRTMPLLYNFSVRDGAANKNVLIPSIYCAYYPEFLTELQNEKKDVVGEVYGKSYGSEYKTIGGYNTFIVSWDRGFLTQRNVSHLKTTLEWVTHYVELKKWEIDHKKSSASFLWVVKLMDTKAHRTWLKMTDAEKEATGLMATKTAGGTLILPPGVELDCKNPNLSSINEQDTDILHMISSGLNKPEDMMTGQTKGSTFSGITASRGPQADRVGDQLAFFERFLRFDFWRHIFFLHNKVNLSFKLEYKQREVIDFKDQNPIFRNVTKPAYKLVQFSFPVSEISDLESKSKALLGVSHSSLAETLGIPKERIAKKLGFQSYRKLRLEHEREKEEYPELLAEKLAFMNANPVGGVVGDEKATNPVYGKPEKVADTSKSTKNENKK